MDLTAWALYLLIAAAVLAGAVIHYRRREPVGRGRYVLAGLRGLALALVVLLVFDPVLPAPRAGRTLPTVALVDASLSMSLRAPDGTTRWEEAQDVVAALDPDVILVFGVGGAAAVAALDPVRPDQLAARLGPALRAAMESGAGRVVVVTDGAIEDVEEARRLAAGSPIELSVRRVGRSTAWNLGLVELESPRWAEAGEEVRVRAGLARLGVDAPDSATVVLRWGDEELARARVATPPEGRTATAALRFTPRPPMEGPVRLDAVIEEDDAEPGDNVRSVYLTVAEEPAGVALVSFRADQEPRFLLPVLERTLGLPARGWLAVGGDGYVRLGVGPEAGQGAGVADVRRAVGEADLVVLHGLAPGSPAWARSAAREARRVLLFPGTLEDLPMAPGERRPGDWYPVAELPPSPVGTFLAGVDVETAPPLLAVRPATAPAGWWVPLTVRQDRRGEAEATLAAGEVGGRRVAVALADGYWRWAFHDAAARGLYDAFWAGVGSWLVAGADVGYGERVRPEPPVVARGQPVRWVVPPTADSLRVALRPVPGPVSAAPGETAAAPTDTVMVAKGGLAVQTPPVAGHYRYEARAFLADGQSADGIGELTVEAYSPEFTRPGRELALEAGTDVERAAVAPPGRPLRAWAWPYALVIVLVCAEWVLRRRWGLR